MEKEYPRWHYLVGALGILWNPLWCALTWIFLIVLILARQVESVNMGPFFTFIVDFKNDARFCRRQMLAKGWAGYAWGNVVFVVDTDTERWDRTVRHELKHVFQQYIFGTLQPIIYFLVSIFIWLFVRKLHSYYDNPFERQARRYAGQRINIPKSKWKDGPEDRWAWW